LFAKASLKIFTFKLQPRMSAAGKRRVKRVYNPEYHTADAGAGAKGAVKCRVHPAGSEYLKKGNISKDARENNKLYRKAHIIACCLTLGQKGLEGRLFFEIVLSYVPSLILRQFLSPPYHIQFCVSTKWSYD
jgi:hypothetical protein